MAALIERLSGEGPLIIGGKNSTFCTGVDLKFAASDPFLATNLTFDLFDALASYRDPVVASVEGAACGAGWLLAALCDTIVTSSEATFSLVEVKIGIPSFVAVDILGDRLPLHLRTAAIFNAEPLSGTTLAALGLAKLAESLKPDDHAMMLSNQLAAHPAAGRRALSAYSSSALQKRLIAAREASLDYLKKSS